MQKALRRARHQLRAGGEFDGEPENENANEIQRGGAGRVGGPLDECHEHRRERVGKHHKRERQTERPSDHRRRGE